MKRLTPIALVLVAACRQDMHDQPRYEAFEKSTFFADGSSARPQVEGTIARGELPGTVAFETGRDAEGELVRELPVELSAELLARGRNRYDVFCSACHGRTGAGDGIVVQRGMKIPTSFHDERLRNEPVGYVFDVITNGFGAMYDYADRIEPRDRWAIAAYMRALQLSQDASLSDVPPEERMRLEEEGP